MQSSPNVLNKIQPLTHAVDVFIKDNHQHSVLLTSTSAMTNGTDLIQTHIYTAYMYMHTYRHKHFCPLGFSNRNLSNYLSILVLSVSCCYSTQTTSRLFFIQVVSPNTISNKPTAVTKIKSAIVRSQPRLFIPQQQQQNALLSLLNNGPDRHRHPPNIPAIISFIKSSLNP